MSFICDNCKLPVKQGVKPIVRVIQTRSVEYIVDVRGEDDEEGKRTYRKETRKGQEIVKEERVCKACTVNEVKP